jgi:predicted metal-dependent hydrolase
MTSESLQFFLEEAIHASAFQRYLDMAATELNLTKAELASFLPKYKRNSLPGILYALEARLGGKAIWWTVAATEEESIRLFQKIASHKKTTDPLFFELNRLHFLEESRHSSFSYKMLKSHSSSPVKKFSYVTSRILQTIWLYHELKQFRKVKQFAYRHPILFKISRLVEKVEALTFREKIRLFMHEISYTKMMTRPEEHPRLKKALERENVIVIRVPEVV